MYFYEHLYFIRYSETKLKEEELLDEDGEEKSRYIGAADTRHEARELLRKNHFSNKHITGTLNEIFGKEEFKIKEQTKTYIIYEEAGYFYSYVKNSTGELGENDVICISKDFKEVKEKSEIFGKKATAISEEISKNLSESIDIKLNDVGRKDLYMCMGQVKADIENVLRETTKNLKRKLDKGEENEA